jgi:glutamate/aspartate transport system substrate-binding protein
VPTLTRRYAAPAVELRALRRVPAQALMLICGTCCNAYAGQASAQAPSQALALTRAPLAVTLPAAAGPLANHAPSRSPGPLRTLLKDSRALLIGVQRAAQPFAFEMPSQKGSFTGYSVQLCEKILQDLWAQERGPLSNETLQISYVPVTPKTRMLLLLTGAIDLECGATSRTREREELGLKFSTAIFVSDVAVLMSKNIGAEGSSLDRWVTWMTKSGGRAVTTAGSTSVNLLRDLRHGGKTHMRWRLGADHDESLDHLMTDRAQAFVMDRALLSARAAQTEVRGKVTLSTWSLEPRTLECYGIMSRKSDKQLGLAINRQLQEMREDGSLQMLYAKWFSNPLKGLDTLPGVEAGRALDMPMHSGLARTLVSPDFEPCSGSGGGRL